MSDQNREIGSSEAFAIYRLPNEIDHILLLSDRILSAAFDQIPMNSFVIGSFEESTSNVSYISGEKAIINGRFVFWPEEECDMVDTGKDQYLKQAESLINEVQSGELEKIVLSRIKLVSTGQEDLFDLFERLKLKHPSAFVYLYHVPGRGVWCGATPEILVQQDGDIIHTMALAGTQRNNGLNLDKVDWTQKEIHEQHVIEQYIESGLGKLNLRFEKKGPYTVEAGEVLHICSDFMITGNHDLAEIIGVLHPGPAICGTPARHALKRILETESHRRQDYCGFVGPLHIFGRTALFINLRCMRIFKDNYVLFIGGGLTQRSLPELEWAETEMKAQTLLNVLDKVYS